MKSNIADKKNHTFFLLFYCCLFTSHKYGEDHLIYFTAIKQTAFHRLSQVQCYDPEADSWLLRANIPIAKRCITAVSLNNLIYVCGGLTKSVFCYDPLQDYWMHVVHTFNKLVSRHLCHYY